MQAAARLVKPLCDGTAKYKIMVDMTWSAENHPTEFPEGGAFFTPFFVRPSNISFVRCSGAALTAASCTGCPVPVHSDAQPASGHIATCAARGQ